MNTLLSAGVGCKKGATIEATATASGAVRTADERLNEAT